MEYNNRYRIHPNSYVDAVNNKRFLNEYKEFLKGMPDYVIDYIREALEDTVPYVDNALTECDNIINKEDESTEVYKINGRTLKKVYDDSLDPVECCSYCALKNIPCRSWNEDVGCLHRLNPDDVWVTRNFNLSNEACRAHGIKYDGVFVELTEEDKKRYGAEFDNRYR